MYVDYDYYHNVWEGTLIPFKDFNQYAMKAQRLINYITQGRAADHIDKVQDAVCAGAEASYEYRQSISNIPQGIKSESTDGYSVTYADFNLTKSTKQEQEAMLKVITQELSGTGLLYRGVR